MSAAILSALVMISLMFSLTSSQPAWSASVDIDAILNDPEAPVAGNPKGDVTIVAFLDYNCPFCKRATPDLDKFIHADGNVRLVYKDWPILTKASVYGAKLALAAKYQGMYDAAHAALMAIPGRSISEEAMLEAVRTSGLDMSRLDADLQAHGSDIAALLKRNLAEADSLGLQGTPVFLIGPFKVAATLDYGGFAKTVAEVRARVAGK
jgi:protein-disulfide isomerase